MFDSCSLVCYKSHQVEMCESRVENAAIQEVLQGNPRQRQQSENQNITNINGKGEEICQDHIYIVLVVYAYLNSSSVTQRLGIRPTQAL